MNNGTKIELELRKEQSDNYNIFIGITNKGEKREGICFTIKKEDLDASKLLPILEDRINKLL